MSYKIIFFSLIFWTYVYGSQPMNPADISGLYEAVIVHDHERFNRLFASVETEDLPVSNHPSDLPLPLHAAYFLNSQAFEQIIKKNPNGLYITEKKYKMNALHQIFLADLQDLAKTIMPLNKYIAETVNEEKLQESRKKIIDAILQNSDRVQCLFQTQDILNRTPLHFAAALGSLQEFKMCQDAIGLNLEVAFCKDTKGYIAFDYAIKCQNFEKIKLMHESGFNFGLQLDIFEKLIHKEIQDLNLENILHICMKNYYCPLSLIELLIDLGVDIEAKDQSDFNPLLRAASKGHVAIAKLFIRKGVNMRIKNRYGHTPLHLAALNNEVDIAKLLVAHGADIRAKDIHGKTPLDLAQEENYTEIVSFLQNAS